MTAYIAFVKKEFIEYVRTYKLLIVFAVFLMFGMFNPIAAKVLPEILSSVMPEGMNITLAEPNAIDSWTQFYKNMTGMQIIIFVIMFSGVVANELSKGTLVNMLTKGLPRKTVILSKFTSITIMWTIGYFLCFVTTYGYTLYLLPGNLNNIFFSALCMWLYGVLLIAVMLLGGVLFANIYGTLIVTGGFAVLLMLLNIIPKVQKLNPHMLASDNLGLLTGKLAVSDFYIPILITCILIFITIISTIRIFNKKKM